MTRLLALIVVVLAYSTAAVHADIYRWDNGQVIPGTEGTNPAPGVILSQHELEYAALSEFDLTGAQLDRTNLGFAVLYDSNLTNANLAGANLSDADFHDAVLTGAHLNDAIIQRADFSSDYSWLSKEQLYSTASYKEKNLAGIALRRNKMPDWSFAGQNLTGADLRHSFIHGDLSGANLTMADLNSAWLQGANLREADLSNANLSQAHLDAADMTDAVVNGANFHSVADQFDSLTKEQIYSTASYKSRNLAGIRLTECELNGWDFHGQDLTNARFSSSFLYEANFRGANLYGANFRGARFRNTVFEDADIRFAWWGNTFDFTREILYSTASYKAKDLQGIQMQQTSVEAWDLRGQNLTDADFTAARLTGSRFNEAVILGTSFSATQLTKEQLYSTASYKAKQLMGIRLSSNDLTNWNLEGQDLTDASFTGSEFNNVNLTNSVISDAGFNGTTDHGFTAQHLYSTASYKSKSLGAISLGENDLTGWDFSGQDLIGSYFRLAMLADADFTDALIAGANFNGTTPGGFTAQQLYTTASYRARLLDEVRLEGNDMAGWDFRNQYLANASFNSSYFENADFSLADLRGTAGIAVTSVITSNAILPNGTVQGLSLASGDQFVVRNYHGDPNRRFSPPVPPTPVIVADSVIVNDGSIWTLVFDDTVWDSSISFEENIPVQLGGTLELTFTPDVDVLSQVGRTFHIFDWTGVEPTGAFTVASPYPWDLSELYTSGEITFLLPGDTNGDQAVTIADLNNVRNNFGAAGGLGDTNGDQQIDIQDLNNVRNFFGTSTPQAVPEPSTLVLATLLVAAAVAARRKAVTGRQRT
jgi:uncharacterized protein YjbI with pentapeptide repeats